MTAEKTTLTDVKTTFAKRSFLKDQCVVFSIRDNANGLEPRIKFGGYGSKFNGSALFEQNWTEANAICKSGRHFSISIPAKEMKANEDP